MDKEFIDLFKDKIKRVPTKLWHFSCLVCGKEYESTNPQITFYCSRECERVSHAKNEYMSPDCIVYNPYDLSGIETRICLLCGDQFIVNKGSDKVFCSPSCENSYANNHHIGKKSVCKYCGKEYYRLNTVKGSFSFCSKDCRERHRRKYGTVKDLWEDYTREHGNKKVCGFCGKEFEIKAEVDLRRKFCSNKCYKEYGNQRKRDKRKQLKRDKEV